MHFVCHQRRLNILTICAAVLKKLTTPGDIARQAQVQRSGLPFARDVFTKCVCVSVAVHVCSLSCSLLFCAPRVHRILFDDHGENTNRPRGALHRLNVCRYAATSRVCL